MESRRLVEAVEVVLFCDECGEKMQHTGMILTSEPPWYPHKCPDCGLLKNYRKKYPYVEYKYKEDDDG